MKSIFLLAASLLFVITIPIFAEEYTVKIPFGSYDPTFDTPAEHWYLPPVLRVQAGDTVTWINDDQEAHTVTSGKGTGRFGWMGGEKFGEKSGIFDSGRFMKGESFSHTFEKEGLYSYFCTIHPWMEAVVYVGEKLPDYPHNSQGERFEQWPIISFTPDGLIELDLSWEPKVIKTNEKVQFIFQTYDPQTNSNLDKMRYDMVIIQEGNEIFRDAGLTDVGGAFQNFVFEEAGPIKIRFENIESAGTSGIESGARQPAGDPAMRTIEFSAMVYKNPDETASTALKDVKVERPQRVDLAYELLVVIIVVPGALAVGAILFMMYKKPKSSKQPSSAV